MVRTIHSSAHTQRLLSPACNYSHISHNKQDIKRSFRNWEKSILIVSLATTTSHWSLCMLYLLEKSAWSYTSPSSRPSSSWKKGKLHWKNGKNPSIWFIFSKEMRLNMKRSIKSFIIKISITESYLFIYFLPPTPHSAFTIQRNMVKSRI